ncbi:MAG: hypothetical protein GY850_38575 [bacterium]|nr:hypothetical protein [bacterium]
MSQERKLTEKLKKYGVLDQLQQIISDLNNAHEKKGGLEEQKNIWVNSMDKSNEIEEELQKINEEIEGKDSLIQERIVEFNKYFSTISYRLYGEQFVLSPEKSDRGYDLNISSLGGNLGTGMKKGQIAAFDLGAVILIPRRSTTVLLFSFHDHSPSIFREERRFFAKRY